MQDLVVGYQSALDFWRTIRVAANERGLDDEGVTVYGARTLALREQTERAIALCATKPPLDVVVTSASARRESADLVSHVWRAPLVEERLVPLGNRIKVCSMPVVFAQLGTELDEIDLALVGYEVAGAYGLTPWARDTMTGGLEPLVDISELRGYVEAACALRVRGAIRARSALDLVVPGSNSPRESEFGVALMLSRCGGGADLSGFAMNKPIALPAAPRRGHWAKGGHTGLSVAKRHDRRV